MCAKAANCTSSTPGRIGTCYAEAMISLVRIRDLGHDADHRRVDLVVSSKRSTDQLFVTHICAPYIGFKAKGEIKTHDVSGHARNGARRSGRGRTSPKSGALAWPHLGVRTPGHVPHGAERSGPTSASKRTPEGIEG